MAKANGRWVKNRLESGGMDGRVLFILWLVFAIAWAVAAGFICHVGVPIETYSIYFSYIRDIQNGMANNYERRSYMEYMPQLQTGGIQFGWFLIVWLSLPVLAWVLGKRFIPIKKKKLPKRPTRAWQ